MSNYYGNFRSNYFSVKNLEKFKKELKKWVSSSSEGNDYDVWDGEGNNKGKIALGGYCSILCKLDDSADNGISEEDFSEFIQKHLDNDVAIIQEVGNDKLKYLAAYTWYISPKIIKFVDGSFDVNIITDLGFSPVNVTRPEY